MPLNDSNDIKELKKFDIDLSFGKQWEQYIDEMFSGAKTCEVKIVAPLLCFFAEISLSLNALP